jgi:hypothetical protein
MIIIYWDVGGTCCSGSPPAWRWRCPGGTGRPARSSGTVEMLVTAETSRITETLGPRAGGPEVRRAGAQPAPAGEVTRNSDYVFLKILFSMSTIVSLVPRYFSL